MFTPSPYCNIYIEYSCILFFVGEESFCLVGDVEVDSIILLVIKCPIVLGLFLQRHECGNRSKLCWKDGLMHYLIGDLYYVDTRFY
jgi:hypothetical protein